MTWLIVLLIVLFFAGAAVGLFGFALCRAAALGDEQMARREREHE